ncbi:MAG TPA: sulfur oxidation c-type cytochrome SoxX [Usitatibacter sp.]|nr:sulfur oxidation c-type cytochrome SoxX [Usitatibacter sp.]
MKTVLVLLSLIVTGCAASTPIADSLETPLAAAGDAARGREVFVSREGGHCVLCHAAPGVGTAGNVGPSLAGVGARLTPGQIRLRIADMPRLNPDAAMPAFHRTEGLARVAPEYRGRPVLTGQQVEDLVAWLSTLR